MTPYLITYSVVLIIGICAQAVGASRRTISWLILFPVILLFSLRFGVGTDYFGYISIIQNIDQFSTFRWEPAFELSARLFNGLGLAPETLLSIYMLTTLLVIGRSISRWSTIPLLSVVCLLGLGYIFFFSNGVRQGLAIAICISSFGSIVNEDLRKFLIYVFLATLFHYTALLFLLAYPLSKTHLRCTIAIPGLLVTYLLSIAGTTEFLYTIVDRWYLVPEFLQSRYSGLVERLEVHAETERTLGLGLRLAFLNLLTAAIAWFGLGGSNPRAVRAAAAITVFGQLLMNIFGGISGAARLHYYFSVFLVLSAPWLNSSVGDNRSRNILFLILVFCITLLFYRLLTTNSHDIIPYRVLLFAG